jgi:hypothetical protein
MRSSRRDDQVGQRDQALRLDRVFGDDDRRQVEAVHVASLCVGAGQNDRVNLRVVSELGEDAGEQRVRLAVVQRDVGRGGR